MLFVLVGDTDTGLSLLLNLKMNVLNLIYFSILSFMLWVLQQVIKKPQQTVLLYLCQEIRKFLLFQLVLCVSFLALCGTMEGLIYRK